MNQSLFSAIRDANQLILYEGLPHDGFEREQFAEEKQHKETVTHHGHLFYATPLTVAEADTTRLKSILASEESFREWRGSKKCGGFHPDYLAEWRVGGVAYQFLLCFGCYEAKVYGPEKSLYCDIHTEIHKQLQELLKPYRKNRPDRRAP